MLSESGLLHIAATVANNTLRGAVGLQSSKADCCAPLCCILKCSAHDYKPLSPGADPLATGRRSGFLSQFTAHLLTAA